ELPTASEESCHCQKKSEATPVKIALLSKVKKKLSELIYKVHGLHVVGNKMYKAFPLPVIEFPLAEELPTASEESCHCQKKSEATPVKIALLSKVKKKLRFEMPLPEVCTAIEEKKKKLPVKDRWQLH
nr:hypothetical protein [Tanacetum cinerariifolium]